MIHVLSFHLTTPTNMAAAEMKLNEDKKKEDEKDKEKNKGVEKPEEEKTDEAKKPDEDEDIFDSLFHLEDSYYNEGYRLGVEDGSRSSRIEGRLFGLEKGFEKFFEMGRLNGRACVWAARMPQKATIEERSLDQDSLPKNASKSITAGTDSSNPTSEESLRVLSFPHNSRLEKHISTLYALSEPESLSTENTEEAISDFEDRFKRAQSKAKIIENIIKEREVVLNDEETDINKQNGGKREGVQITKAAAAEKNMEDFGLKGAP